jgi:hypothetical protein
MDTIILPFAESMGREHPFNKTQHRKALRELSFSEKVKKVVELQKIAAPVLRARGQHVRVWALSEEPREH